MKRRFKSISWRLGTEVGKRFFKTIVAPAPQNEKKYAFTPFDNLIYNQYTIMLGCFIATRPTDWPVKLFISSYFAILSETNCHSTEPMVNLFVESYPKLFLFSEVIQKLR